MFGFILSVAVVLLSPRADAAALIWKGSIFLTAPEVLDVAMAIDSAREMDEFRLAVARQRPDVDAFLGGLISMLGTEAERDEFARRFGVEDPVYGTPAQMRSQSPRFKMVLMRLAMRAMSTEDLRLIRSLNWDPTPGELAVLETFIRGHRPPLTAAEIIAVWTHTGTHCEALAAGT
jgi:hypothetical protein